MSYISIVIKRERFNIPWSEGFLVILMVAAAATIFPAEMGARANPSVTPLPILSDWYFLALYQMYKYIEPVLATFVTVLIPATVLLLPFADTGKRNKHHEETYYSSYDSYGAY